MNAEERVSAQHFHIPVIEVERFMRNCGGGVDKWLVSKCIRERGAGGELVIRSICDREVGQGGDADGWRPNDGSDGRFRGSD